VPNSGGPRRNAQAVVAALAADPDADLAAFPELFLSGYDLGHVATLSVIADHPALTRIRVAARRHETSVIVGFAEQTRSGVANALACIGPTGEWASTYRKTQRFGKELEVFAAGDRLLVVDLGNYRVGPLICFDVEFPEPARALSLAGAGLLVTAAANIDPYGPDHAVAIRVRALDNRRPHIYVKGVGCENWPALCGRKCRGRTKWINRRAA
jgi:(R)-amidase